MIYASSYSVLLRTLLSVIFVCGVFGCDKSETPDSPQNQTNSNFTVFSNQSGSSNESADALQARYTDPQTGDIVDFYGSYDQAGIPDQVNTVRVQTAGNDTVLNFIIDPVTDNFDKAIFEVNGVRLETMVTFDFPAGDTSMVLSFYNVNWGTGSSELIYSGEFADSNGTLTENPLFQARYAEINGNGFADLLAGIGVGIGVAEIAVAVGAIGGSGLAGTAAGVVAAGMAAVGVKLVLTAVAVGIAVTAISNAHSAEQEPQSTPYPNGTPVNNPTPDPEPSLDPLSNPCQNASPTINLGIDNGNELVAIATGGTGGPYTFSWSDGTVSTENTYHAITVTEQDVYTVAVVDGNGCATSASIQWPLQTGVWSCWLSAPEGQELEALNCGYDPNELWEPSGWTKDGQPYGSCVSYPCFHMEVTEPGTYSVTYIHYGTADPPIQCGEFVVGGVEGNLVCP